jgi:hypothetical protein
MITLNAWQNTDSTVSVLLLLAEPRRLPEHVKPQKASKKEARLLLISILMRYHGRQPEEKPSGIGMGKST